MKLLLDTHIWIWAAERPERLSREIKRQLINPRNEIYLSPVSIWEAAMLEKRGRLKARDGFASWVTAVLKSTPVREAPMTLAVALEASRITLPEPDPGDLFIAATALVSGCTLVTGDSQLLACDWLTTMANG